MLCGFLRSGQVAQLVERSPEKAGVGGSTPSLATIFINDIPISGSQRLRTFANKTICITSLLNQIH